MVHMSLDCPFFIVLWCICLWIVHSLLSYGAYVSGLSILYRPMVHMSLDCPFFIVLWCICLWIVHSLLPLRFSLTFMSSALTRWTLMSLSEYAYHVHVVNSLPGWVLFSSSGNGEVYWLYDNEECIENLV
jgi:hypothetical protein